MKSRMLLSPLWKIRSWKKLFLFGKKSLEKPTVELPREIIESEVLPRLHPTVELLHEIIDTRDCRDFNNPDSTIVRSIPFVNEPQETSTSNEGLAECKAPTSNLRRIQVRDIIKEVKDYLKTYSSAGMDISSYVDGIREGFKEIIDGNTLAFTHLANLHNSQLLSVGLYKFACKLDSC
nr:hypothetical protein [Tanacetum cinerariifolium]